MPVFQNSEALYRCLELLFGKIHNLGPGATHSLLASRLVIRFRLTSPAAQVLIDGRVSPAQVSYVPVQLRPDMDVELTADALHFILLKQLSLKKALAIREMRVRGPVWRIVALEEILHHGQDLYPQVLRELGLVA